LEEEAMKNTGGFPWYVKAGLIGIHNKKGALVQLWTGIGISVILLFFGLYSDSLLWTLVFCASVLLTATWYWTCIRWVDRNAKWER
jgi:hypothetical protein